MKRTGTFIFCCMMLFFVASVQGQDLKINSIFEKYGKLKAEHIIISDPAKLYNYLQVTGILIEIDSGDFNQFNCTTTISVLLFRALPSGERFVATGADDP